MKKFRYTLLSVLFILLSLWVPGTASTHSETQIQHLETFTRLYGYIKYFYPGDEAAQTNWDAFALYGVKKLTNGNIETISQLKQALEELFSPIAPALVIHETAEKSSISKNALLPPGVNPKEIHWVSWQHLGLGSGKDHDLFRTIRLLRQTPGSKGNETHNFQIKPLFKNDITIGTTVSRELGSGLSCIFPLALCHTTSGTYPQVSKQKLQEFRQKLATQTAALENFPFSPSQQVAGVVIAWNAINHFYPQFPGFSRLWRQALSEALKTAIQPGSHTDYLKILNRMLAYLDDGQAGAFLPADKSRMYLPPIDWEWRENQLVIAKIFEPQQTNLNTGDVIVQLEDIPVLDAFKQIETGISAPTAGWKRFRACEELLRGKPGSHLSLKVKREGAGGLIGLSAARTLFSPTYFGYKEKLKKASGEILPGIFYVNTDITPGEGFHTLLPQLRKARVIIYDLRGSPKDNPLLLRHFIKKKSFQIKVFVPTVSRPDGEATGYQVYGWNEKPLKPFLKAKLIAISDYSSIDSAERRLQMIRQYDLGTIVGRHSAGAVGAIDSCYLLGKYLIRWTGAWDSEPGNESIHRKGISPDILVKPTLKELKENQSKDCFLEKALELARKFN